METATSSDFLTVSSDELEIRLDKFLVNHFPQHSRTYFQYLIDNGCVLVNGEPIKKRQKPKAGDEIEICFELTPEISLEPENIPLAIIFEDEHILAVNKPVGMVVHPATGHYSGTFVNALLFHCKKIKQEFSIDLRPGIIHRLDKDTSGIILAAKTQEAHQKMIALFYKREIEKKYLAICVGTPKEGIINAPLGRHKVRRKEICVDTEKGREALSEVRLISKKENLSLAEVKLITGRTHQIRVHLKHIQTPILGDQVYGSHSANKTFNATRQMLHAHKLNFIHPFTHKPIALEAPIPKDMQTLIDTIED